MVEGVNSSMIYLMYCNNFCKCHNVPPPGTTIKRKNMGFRIRFSVQNLWFHYN
jgi:hypothetical protein